MRLFTKVLPFLFLATVLAKAGTSLNLEMNGWWKLDESGVSNTAVDSGSSPHNGTYNGGMITSPIVPAAIGTGYSASFNHILNQYINTGAASAYYLYPMSFSFWIKAKAGASTLNPISNYNTGSKIGWEIFGCNGSIPNQLTVYYFKDASNYVWDLDAFTFLTGTVCDGTWHNVIYTIDSSGGKIYTDNVLSNSLAWHGTPGAQTSGPNLTIGAGWVGNVASGSFDGYLDDVRIFNSSISSGDRAAIQTNSATTATPVSWWKFDQANFALDSSGYGWNGTYAGLPVPAPSPSVAPIGTSYPNPYALNFSTNATFVTTNKLSTFGASPFSVCYWFNTTTAFSAVIRVIGNYNGGFIFWGSGFDGSAHPYFALRDSVGNVLVPTGSTSYSDGAWHLYCGVRISASSTALYIDGASVATASGTTVGAVDSTQTLTIGRDIGTGAPSNYTGLLDDLRLYTRALSAAEVLNLYQGKY